MLARVCQSSIRCRAPPLLSPRSSRWAQGYDVPADEALPALHPLWAEQKAGLLASVDTGLSVREQLHSIARAVEALAEDRANEARQRLVVTGVGGGLATGAAAAASLTLCVVQ